MKIEVCGLVWMAVSIGLITGCESSPATTNDSGMSVIDAGSSADADVEAGSPAMDGGEDAAVAADSGVADTGPPRIDAGPATGDCVVLIGRGSFGPLTRACVPRCSAATRTAYEACTTNRCRAEALDADRTAGVRYYLNDVSVRSAMDCNACFEYSRMHCFSLVCPAQVDEYVDGCIDTVDDARCDNALFELDLCLQGLGETGVATVESCFVSQLGPYGCFAD